MTHEPKPQVGRHFAFSDLRNNLQNILFLFNRIIRAQRSYRDIDRHAPSLLSGEIVNRPSEDWSVNGGGGLA